MQEFVLPYNHTQLTVHLPDTYEVDVLLPEPLAIPEAPEALFAAAFATPVGRAWPLPTCGWALQSTTRPARSPRRTP